MSKEYKQRYATEDYVDETVKHIDPKYIKDMYYEGIEMTEILPETIVEIDPDENIGIIINSIGLIAGKTYAVNYNGARYTCVARSVDINGLALTCLGDVSMAWSDLVGGSSTGEPFIIAEVPSSMVETFGCAVMVMVFEAQESVRLSISGETYTIHKMNPKYIDGMYYTEQDDIVYMDPYTFEVVKDDDVGDTANITGRVNWNAMEAGKTYCITWDGVEYKQQLILLQNYNGTIGTRLLIFGNSKYFFNDILGLGDTGEPFVIGRVVANDGIQEFFSFKASDALTHTISITGADTVHKIDEKYLPDSAVTTEQQFHIAKLFIADKYRIVDDICYGNNKYVLLKKAFTPQILWSTDFVTWNPVTLENENLNSFKFLFAICYGNGKFVAVSHNQIVYSTDAITWEVVDIPIENLTNRSDTCKILYTDKFVLLTKNKILYSEDAIIWNEATIPTVSFKFTDFAYGGGRYIAVNNDGAMIYSDDGITWNNGCAAINTVLTRTYKIGYINNTFYIVTHKYVYITQDGVVRSSPIYIHSIESPQTVFGFENTIITVCYQCICYSQNGTDWQIANVYKPNASKKFTSGAYINGKYIALTDDNMYFVSYDGKNWYERIVLQDGDDITIDYLSLTPKMVGATANTNGAAGLVPTPVAGDENKVLTGDGTYKSFGDIPIVLTDEATGKKYKLSVVNGNLTMTEVTSE